MPDGTEVDAFEAAELAAEALRALAHLTGKPHGLHYPSDVTRILGALSVAVARLPQSLAQMLLLVGEQHAAEQLVDDYGPTHVDEAVADLAGAGYRATVDAELLVGHLDAAQRAVAGLSYTGPTTGAEA
jgi:hypothetical protein